MFHTRFLSPTDQKCEESSTRIDSSSIIAQTVNSDLHTWEISLKCYAKIYDVLDNRYEFFISVQPGIDSQSLGTDVHYVIVCHGFPPKLLTLVTITKRGSRAVHVWIYNTSAEWLWIDCTTFHSFFSCLKKKCFFFLIFKSWQVCDLSAKWIIMLRFMDLRWPRVSRRPNVGLVFW